VQQETAALRDFSPVYVRYGSSATNAGEAWCPCMSALPCQLNRSTQHRR